MCGAITPGMAIDARIASSSGPCCSHTGRPVTRSVATAVNVIGRSSIATSPTISRTLSKIFSARRMPGAENVGSSRRSTAPWVSPPAHSVNSCRAPAA